MRKLVQKLTVTFSALALLVAPAAMMAAPAYAQADIDQNLCAGADLDVNSTAGCDEAATGETVNDLIADVINIFSLVVGVVSVIMIIIGGLKYITSGGESGNITGAKNTILYAIIGLVVVALAQVIVKFVLTRTTEAV